VKLCGHGQHNDVDEEPLTLCYQYEEMVGRRNRRIDDNAVKPILMTAERHVSTQPNFIIAMYRSLRPGVLVSYPHSTI
jgi:hypothetical protein